jgi:alkylation response protein AidB-like acyl-CoA dehydrogenase
MRLELTEEQQLVQDSAREFAKRIVAPGAAERDETGRFPSDLMEPLAEMGFMGMLVSENFGGSGMGYVNYSLALAEIARGCASTAVTMGVNNLTASAIDHWGSDALKSEVLPRMCAAAGGKPAAFALSEAHCGSDAAALTTSARRDGDYYVLDGSKQWITSGAYASYVLVMARTGEGSGGISAFVVDGDAPGMSAGPAEQKMGLKGSNTVPLMLEDVRVPASRLLGQEGDGFRIAMHALDGGRIGISAQSLGIGLAAVGEATRYMSERKAFGKTIDRLQALQFMIADAATELEASRLLMLQAADLRDRKQPMSKQAAMAKVFASEACGRAVDSCLQIHGGYGYVKEFAIERLYRDARVTRIYEGTSEVQRVVIARSVLRD